MSMQTLAALEQKHRELKAEITDVIRHRGIDDLRVTELKRRKLLVKDEIEKLKDGVSVH